MHKFLVSLSTFIYLFLNSEGASVRIVNGTNANEGEFPFAAILREDGGLTCGTTILNENFLLTAAHCACTFEGVPENASLLTIQYGTIKVHYKNNIIQVKKVYCNKFNIFNKTFDSAILELEKSLPRDGNWSRITIAKTFNTSMERNGIIIGWGSLEENIRMPSTLQKLKVEIYDDDVCRINFQTEHQICLGAENGGACYGDSGSALLVDGVQVGIASFINEDCGIANKNYPNVYSRIPRYFEWIESIAGDVEFTYL